MLLYCTQVYTQTRADLLHTSIVEDSHYKENNKTIGYELIAVTARFGTAAENAEKIIESITLREIIRDTMFIEIETAANCCAAFSCELEVKSKDRINLKFEKSEQDCFCLKGIFLTYQIAINHDLDHQEIELNGKHLEYRKFDPNESRDVLEKYEDGTIKSMKMYLGHTLKRVTYFDEHGNRTKMIMYNNGKVIEKNF
jgi:hypothetical protein